jgi:hypothetical protein
MYYARSYLADAIFFPTWGCCGANMAEISVTDQAAHAARIWQVTSQVVLQPSTSMWKI